MFIDIENLYSFSQCPRYHYFLNQEEEDIPPKSFLICKEVIQKSELKFTKTGHKVDWRTISGWVNKEIFKGSDNPNDEEFTQLLSLSKDVLELIKNWYYDIYMESLVKYFSNIPLSSQYKKHSLYYKADLLGVGKNPRIIVLSNKQPESKQLMYNNISLRTAMAIVGTELQIGNVDLQWIYIGINGGIKSRTIKTNYAANKRTLKSLNGLIDSYVAGAIFPSYTTSCKDCKFVQKCIL